MRSSLRQFLRIWHIGVILKRYRLDKLFNTAQLPAPIRWLRVSFQQEKIFQVHPGVSACVWRYRTLDRSM